MIRLGTNPKVNAVIEKYNIEKTREAYTLIEQLISHNFPIEEMFSEHNSGPIKNGYFEVIKIKGSELENNVFLLSSKRENYVVVGRPDTMSWYVRKLEERLF